MGTRNNDKKGKPSAAQMYKDRLAAQKGDKPMPTKDEMYKKMIEDRMAKMMEDYLMGRKKNAVALPGTKSSDDKPKEVSKTTLMVIKMLAHRREQKDRKMEKKRDMAFQSAKRAKAAEEKRVQMFEEQAKAQKEAEYLAQAEANRSYWSSSDDNKNSWW